MEYQKNYRLKHTLSDQIFFEYHINLIIIADLPYNIQTPCLIVNCIYPKYILDYNVNMLKKVEIYF